MILVEGYLNGKVKHTGYCSNKEDALKVFNRLVDSNYYMSLYDRIVIRNGNTILFDSED